MSDAKILLYVNKPLDPASSQAAFHASQNGVLPQGVLTPLAGNRGFQFVPAQPWPKGALVQVFFDSTAKDALGNALNSYQGSFRVEPDPATFTGSLVAIQPGGGMQGLPVNPVVDFQYNKALDPATVMQIDPETGGYANVVLYYYDASYQQVQMPVTVSLVKGGRVIRMIPKAPVAPNAYYYHQVSGGVHDLQGNAVYGWGSYFQTGEVADADLQGPTVEGMNPPEGLENVGINGHVHIRYSKPVDPISLAPAGQAGAHPLPDLPLALEQPPDRVRADDPAKGLLNPPGRQVGAARVLLDPFHHLPFLVLAEAVLAPAPLPLQYPVNPALRPLILPARHRVPVEPRDRANLVNRVSPAAQQNGLRPLPDTPRPVAILQRLQVHYLLFRMRRNTR